MAQPVKTSYLLVRKCPRSKAMSGPALGRVTGCAMGAFPKIDLNVKHKALKHF